jgi:HEAT repeat protein
LDREESREEAIHKLGDLKDKKAIPPLLKLLKDSPPDRPAVAQTLGMIGDSSVVQPLLAALDPDPGSGGDEVTHTKHRANERIVQALGSLRAKEAEDAVLKLLSSHEQYEKLAAVHALGEIGSKKSVGPLCDIVRHDDNMFMKKTATEALGNIGDADAVSCLVEAMFIEKGASIYPQASFALVQVGPAAVPALLDAMQHKNAVIEKMKEEKGFLEGAVEAKCAEVLGDLRAKAAEEQLIKLFKETKNPIIQRNVAIALSRFGGPKSVEAIAKVANEPASDLREFYVDALNELADRGALPALAAASKSGDATAKLVAFVAYSRLADARELAAATALSSKDADMQKEMARFAAAKECGDNADCWIGKLKSPDAKVRDRAGYALGRMGDKKAAAPLLDAAKDDNNDARYAAIWALYRVGNKSQIPALQKIIDSESGHMQFIRVNEDTKRLIVFLNRAA